MSKFAVVNADTGEEMLKFETGGEAAKASREINDSWRERGSDFRTRVVKLEVSYDEAEVASRRQSVVWFVNDDSGRDHAPWWRESWWARVQSSECLHHVAHGSFADPERIRFYSTVDALMEQGKRVTLSVGAYLNKFALDVHGNRLFDDSETQELVLLWSNHFANRVLHTSMDSDKIVEVYQNGPRSCMRYVGKSFAGSVHPCKVYGYGDLGIAWFTADDDPDSTAKARAMIWPAEKVYSTIYGDDTRMARLLQEAGYESGSLEGARIEKIEDGDGYIMPYIDGAYAVTDHGDHFVIDGCGEVSADSINGLSYDRGTPCANCGDMVSDDECRHALDDGQIYCDHCIQWCGDCGEYHSTDYDFEYIRDAGEMICCDCAAQNYTRCEECCEYFEEYVSDEQGSCYCNECAAERTCVDCGVVDDSDVDDINLHDEKLCSTCNEERDDKDDDDDDDSDEGSNDDA